MTVDHSLLIAARMGLGRMLDHLRTEPLPEVRHHIRCALYAIKRAEAAPPGGGRRPTDVEIVDAEVQS